MDEINIEYTPPLIEPFPMPQAIEVVPVYNIFYSDRDLNFYIEISIVSRLTVDLTPVLLRYCVSVIKESNLNILQLLRANANCIYNFLARDNDLFITEFPFTPTIEQVPQGTLNTEMTYFQFLSANSLETERLPLTLIMP